MNFLLDTHILLWAAFTPETLPLEAREIILDPQNELWFSPVAIWECAIKKSRNRSDFKSIRKASASDSSLSVILKYKSARLMRQPSRIFHRFIKTRSTAC